jgi:hypothetical protein
VNLCVGETVLTACGGGLKSSGVRGCLVLRVVYVMVESACFVSLLGRSCLVRSRWGGCAGLGWAIVLWGVGLSCFGLMCVRFVVCCVMGDGFPSSDLAVMSCAMSVACVLCWMCVCLLWAFCFLRRFRFL